jgi:phospholipid transport system substrate-binding protein
VVNNPGSVNEKRAAMTQIINAAVDVDGIGRFCLGRYWRTASEQQQKQYLELFHEVLITNITSKLGEYKGVGFTMGRSRPQDEEAAVSTTVERPNNPPTAVDWIIANPSTSPKIIDVVAEGTSLRLTQRSDYASYLAHNSNSVDALIAAMRQQVSQGNAKQSSG